MKRTFTIDSNAAIKAGLYGVKNIPKLMVLEFLAPLSYMEQNTLLDIDRQVALKALAVLNVTSSTLRKYYESLDEEGFIFYKKDGRHDLIYVTDFGLSLFYDLGFEPERKLKEKKKRIFESEAEEKLFNRIGEKQYDILMNNKKEFAHMPQENKAEFMNWLEHRKERAPCKKLSVMVRQANPFFVNTLEVCRAAVYKGKSGGEEGWINIEPAFVNVLKELPKEKEKYSFDD
jgi:hypothetical protein